MARVRKSRRAEMPPSFMSDPLMYQGGSEGFVGPRHPISIADEAWGIDFEGEVAVVTDDVPSGQRDRLPDKPLCKGLLERFIGG